MSARCYSPDEERLYRLPPLPDVPWIGDRECAQRRLAYEAHRAEYRRLNPHKGREAT